ncbi:Hypothetical protein NocV09_00303580 [Nannochloropsis oceanica]
MFRHSALLFMALLCVADAQFEALTVKNKTKTGNKLPKGAHNDKTNLRKVDGFNLCTQSYEAYIGGTGIAGTGAFSYPVYPGDCNEVDSTTEQIGTLSATCSGNPYEGTTFTFTAQATTENFVNPLQDLSCSNTNGCTFSNPDIFPQFLGSLVNISVIPDNTTAEEVQTFTDQICADIFDVVPALSKISQCSAELRLSGDNRKNKHPGSGLSFDYTTNTTLVPAGSTYTTITQYGLGAGLGYLNPIFYVGNIQFYAYQVIDSITCVARPNTIDETFGKIYFGAGRFAKYAASKVASVELDTVLVTGPVAAMNPANIFELFPQEWETQLEVNYVKPYLHSSML